MGQVSARGLVYLFTGDGKGKTSAAFWTGVRSALLGKKVAVVQWYKEARWPTTEQEIEKYIPNLKVYLMGKGFYKLPTDHADEVEHAKSAQEAMVKAEKLLKKVDVLILDEINNAVSDKLIDVDSVLELLSKRGKVHIVLTGRGANPRVIKEADLVTEMKKIKHPFDQGVKAVRGLDY